MVHKKYSRNLKMKVAENIIDPAKTQLEATIYPSTQSQSTQNLSEGYQPRINENDLFSLFTADVSNKNMVYFR